MAAVEAGSSSNPGAEEVSLCPRLCGLRLTTAPNSAITVFFCAKVAIVYAKRTIKSGEVITVNFQPLFSETQDYSPPAITALHNASLRMKKFPSTLVKSDQVASKGMVSLVGKVQDLYMKSWGCIKDANSCQVSFLAVVAEIVDLFEQNPDLLGVSISRFMFFYLMLARTASDETGKPDPTESFRRKLESVQHPAWQNESPVEVPRSSCPELQQVLGSAEKETESSRSQVKPVIRHCALCFKEVSEPVFCPECDNRAYCRDSCRLKDWLGPKGVGHKRWCGGLWSEEDTDWALISDNDGDLSVTALRDFHLGEAIMVDRLLTRFESQRSRLFRDNETSSLSSSAAAKSCDEKFDRSYIRKGDKKFIGPRFQFPPFVLLHYSWRTKVTGEEDSPLKLAKNLLFVC